jgi:hypothetical protein
MAARGEPLEIRPLVEAPLERAPALAARRADHVGAGLGAEDR